MQGLTPVSFPLALVCKHRSSPRMLWFGRARGSHTCVALNSFRSSAAFFSCATMRRLAVERAVQPAQVLLPRRRGEGGAVSWMLECTRVLQNYCTYYLLFSTEENGTGNQRRGTASLDRTSSVRLRARRTRTVLCEGSSSLNSLLCYVCFTDSIVCMVYFV